MSTPGHEHEHEPDAGPELEWRALYRDLEPPPLADDASGSDARTAEVVAWMRTAWQALETPAPIVPRRPRFRLLRGRTLLAAAAAVLALLGTAWWSLRLERSASGRVERASEVAGRPAPVPTVVGAVSRPAVEILDVRPDHIELRSGPVRLVLLDAPSEHPQNRSGS